MVDVRVDMPAVAMMEVLVGGALAPQVDWVIMEDLHV